MLIGEVLHRQAALYNVILPADKLQVGRNLSLSVTELFLHLSKPFPRELAHDNVDGQYLKWSGDLLGGYALLGHDIADARVRVRMPTPRSQSWTTPPNFNGVLTPGSATIVYTSKSAIKATTDSHKAAQVASVHFFQPDPVIAYRHLRRKIGVSHWTSAVTFEEDIELINNGPACVRYYIAVFVCG